MNHINSNDNNDKANIVTGALSIDVAEDNWPSVETFIKSMNVPYEVVDVKSYTLSLEAFRNTNIFTF
jgi:hypothetical protein